MDNSLLDVRDINHKYIVVGKKVITYVIYSGGITNVKSELDCGLYTYRVQPIYLKNKNADEVFRKLKQKQDNGEAFRGCKNSCVYGK